MRTNLALLKIVPWTYWVRHPLKFVTHARAMLKLDRMERKVAGRVI